jgi:hypothetical protein
LGRKAEAFSLKPCWNSIDWIASPRRETATLATNCLLLMWQATTAAEAARARKAVLQR